MRFYRSRLLPVGTGFQQTPMRFILQKFGAKVVVNLSNIEKVYTDDPKKNPEAKPIDSISWTDFRKIVGDEWQPGKNCPFDPIASKKAQAAGLTVICAGGKNIENIRHILDDKKFIGTVIGRLRFALGSI